MATAFPSLSLSRVKFATVSGAPVKKNVEIQPSETFPLQIKCIVNRKPLIVGDITEPVAPSVMLDWIESHTGIRIKRPAELGTECGWKSTLRLVDHLRYNCDQVEVDIICTPTQAKLCPSCNKPIQQRHGESRSVCYQCNITMVDATPITVYSGSMNGLGGTSVGCSNNGSNATDGYFDTTSSSSDHTFGEERGNFQRAWDAVHGRNAKIPEDTFTRLDAYFAREGGKTGEEIRKQPVIINMYGEEAKEGTSVEGLHKALKALRLSVYVDEFYIRHAYWGWPLPNAESVKERVFINYERMRRVYPMVEESRESSGLNAMYWMYQCLRGAGFKISPHLFNLVETPKIREWHERVCKRMCELASQDGDVPIPFFPTL